MTTILLTISISIILTNCIINHHLSSLSLCRRILAPAGAQRRVPPTEAAAEAHRLLRRRHRRDAGHRSVERRQGGTFWGLGTPNVGIEP